MCREAKIQKSMIEMAWACWAEGREWLGEQMHKNEFDRCGGQMCSEENMEELCQERHEGYGYKGGNSAGPLCLEENNWGSDPR